MQELTFLLFIFNARDDLATFPPRNLGCIGCVNPFAHWKTKKNVHLKQQPTILDSKTSFSGDICSTFKNLLLSSLS